MNRSEIVSAQIAQLRRLLDVIQPRNRFYAGKFAGKGLDANLPDLNEFARRAPFTTKQELVEDQAAFPPFGTNLTFPLEAYTRFHQTSGTTGQPLRWLDTPESWDWMLASWHEVYRAAGLADSDRVFFAFSFGPFIGFWLAFEAAADLGALCIPGGGLSSAARLRMILDDQVTVLCCTPTYAIRLGETAAEENISLNKSRVRLILVAGEPGGSIPSTRARIENLWPGARVFDHHGMTEVGPVTFECPSKPGLLHVIESSYLAEIIDPAIGQPVEPGAPGELVLTTLGRIGSPLIRYRTGDLVKAAPFSEDISTCACGRYECGLEGGILGRADDMVMVRGVNVYPSGIEGILRTFEHVAEYQAQISQVKALTEITVRLEPASDCPDPFQLAKEVEKAFQSYLSLRIPVQIVPPGSLPRFEMKGKRWVIL